MSMLRLSILAGLLIVIPAAMGSPFTIVPKSLLIVSPAAVGSPFTIVTKKDLIDGKFVKGETGIIGTKSRVEVFRQSPSTAPYFRIEFRPNKHEKNLKSRLELSSCFVSKKTVKKLSPKDQNYLLLMSDSDKIPASRFNMLCQASNEPIDAIYTFKYKLLIESENVSNANYILTQWHGSPDSHIMKGNDTNPCIAEISDADLKTMCEAGKCKKGVVTDARGVDTGLRYHQGGYPPLVLKIKNGKLIVQARSDDRVFMNKGGCGDNAKKCSDYPHQQLAILWESSLDKMRLDTWNEFEWNIKWSEYGVRKLDNDDKTDPGVILSNAWIRLNINNEEVVNWTGPCGRNDQGRVPFFKIGIYNPSGSKEDIDLVVHDFDQRYKKVSQIKSKKTQQILRNLKTPFVGEVLKIYKTTNYLKEGTTFNFKKDKNATCQLKANEELYFMDFIERIWKESEVRSD